MSERQQNITPNESRISRIIRSKPFLYSTSATIMGTVAGLAIMGGGEAHAQKYNPFSDHENPSHVLQIKDLKTTHLSEARLVNAKKTVTVEITERGESLTQATARETGTTVQEAYKILEKNGLAHNDLVYVHDQFNVDVSGDITTADTNVAPDTTHAKTQAPSESNGVNRAPAVAATTITNKSESIVQAPATQTPESPKSTATLDPTSTKEPTAAAAGSSKPDLKDKATPTPTSHVSKKATSPNVGVATSNENPTATSTTITTKGAATTNTEATPVTCYLTDYTGFIEKDSDLVTSNPSVTHLKNIRPVGQTDCPPANVWFRTTAANQAPNTTGWLENQTPIISQITVHKSDGSTILTSTDVGMVTVPDGATDFRVDVTFPKGNYCWIQEDVVRTSSTNVKDYHDDNMVNFAFYPNPDMDPVTCQPKPTVTPTNTATSTVTFTPTSTATEAPTGTATNTPEAGCTDSDVKGEFTDNNHYSGNPVKGVVSNIATNKACSDDIYVHMYGSMQAPETSGWIESQKGNHIKTIKIDVPGGAVDQPIEVTVPNTDFCWVQVDLTRNGEILEEPRYIDNDYVFVKDVDSCLPTATPTNTATSTVTFTPTSTNTPETPTVTNTPSPTNTPEAPTNTAIPTNTPKPRIVAPPNTGSGPDNSDRGNIMIWAAMAATASMASFAAARRVGRSRDMLTNSLVTNLDLDKFDILEDNVRDIVEGSLS